MLSERQILRTGAIGALVLVLLAPVALVTSQQTLATTFNSPIDWVPADFPERIQWAGFADRFNLGETIYVSWPTATLDNPRLQNVAEAIRQSEPEAVRAAIAGSELFDGLQSGPWGVSATEAALRLEGSIVGPDRNQSLVVVHLTEAGSAQRTELVQRLVRIAAEMAEVPVSEIRLIGIPVEGSVIDKSATQSIARYALPSALVAIFICWVCLRSVWLTVAISSVAMVGQGLSLGAVLLTGQPMNAILIVLPPLVFVLTVSAGIHLSNYFLESVAASPDAGQVSVIHAMRAGTMPCLLASATTIIGLGSLVVVPIVPVRHFGILSSLSIAFTMLMLLAVLPAAMLLAARAKQAQYRQTAHKRRVALKGPHQDVNQQINQLLDDTGDGNAGSPESVVRLGTGRAALERLVDRVYHIPVRHPVPVIAAILTFCALFVYGLRNIETSVAITNLFATDHPMREDYRWFESYLGPTVGGELQIRFTNLDQSNAIDRLRLVNALHRLVASQPGISGVMSPGIFLPTPPSSSGFSNRLRRASIAAHIDTPEPTSLLVTSGFLAKEGEDEYWRISYRVPLESDVRFAARVADVEIAVRTLLQSQNTTKGIEVTSTGEVMLFEAAQANLLIGLLNSFITAFAIVAVVMMVLLRSIFGGFLAMIPNILPTLVTFGFLGLTKTPLDIGAVMTASLALGIAVDDTVHLLSRFSSFKRLGHSANEATIAALRQCGPAMAQTTFVCGISMMVYVLSDFLPTSRFSLLMVCLLSTAILGDLLLLPAILSSRLGEYFARPVLSTDEPLLESDSIE